MRSYIGAGWYLYSVTDRVIELRKDCPIYRRFTGGRDGYVRTRIEPQMTRRQALDEAIRFAQKNDELLALKVGAQLIPNKMALAKFQGKQLQMTRVFGVRGDEEGRRYQP